MFLGLGFAFNPNSIFLIVIAAFFIESKKQFTAIFLSGIVSFSFYQVFLYWAKPLIYTPNIHRQWAIDFNWNQFLDKINHTDLYLNWFTPSNGLGSISFLLPVILLFFVKNHKYKRLVLGTYILLLFFSFGINKISDGDHDLLFSYSRFYIAIGFVNAVLTGLILGFIYHKNIKLLYLIIGVGCLTALFSFVNINSKIKELKENCGQTYAVKKVYIKEMLKNVIVMQEIIKNVNSNNLVLTADFPLYSECIYLKTLELQNTTIAFHNTNMFYWLDREMKSRTDTFDLIMITTFPTLLEKNRLRYASHLNDTLLIPYFYEKKVTSWYKIREMYFKD